MKTSIKVLFFLLAILPSFSMAQQAGDTPNDYFYDRVSPSEREIIPYDHIRESDIFWHKRIWRVIDVDEKLNLPFKYFHKDWQDIKPLIEILLDGLKSGELTGYEEDSWKTTTTYADAIKKGGAGYDTISKYDPATGEVIGDTAVFNEFDLSGVKRYRVKEDWFFDTETSTLQCRIIGIAPLFHDEQLGDIPLFWAYYPTLRKTLVKEDVFNPLNDVKRMSWDDLFESRMFSSYIVKESNVFDRRIQDYMTGGIDALMESEKIKNDIFNFEHDLWSF